MGIKRTITFATILLSTLAVTFCKKEVVYLPRNDESAEKPVLPATPDDYKISHNDHLATLGRVLFYDKELSANKNISCGSCHKQEHAFTDALRFSPGTDNIHTDRNTPTIFAKNGRLFWDGRSNGMNDLVLRPIRNPIEMNMDNIPALIEKMVTLDYYQQLFKNAFPNANRIDSHMVKSALTEFLINFNFSDNKFTHSEQGTETLNPSEELGRSLFFGKAQCSQCHHIQPNNFGGGSSGYGNTNESHNIGLDVNNPDPGVGKITNQPSDLGSFMMPVLLNVEMTAPYMHDGRFNTLEQVVEHYNSGIKNNPGLDSRLRDYNGAPIKLNLSIAEKKGLVDFLKTLTDPSVTTDKKFSNPFVARVR